MKRLLRDTIFCVAAVAATALAVWFFLKTVEQKKTIAQADLYGLIATETEALLAINRPELFCKTILTKEPIRRMLALHVPDVFFRIAAVQPPSSPILISLHSQGAVIYAQADSKQAHRIAAQVLKPYFSTYAPQQQKKDGINFTFYPDTANHFFGCYEHNGAWVASYSKKLLEEAARQQLRGRGSTSQTIGNFRKQSDKYAPLNILVSSNSLNLSVATDDSTEWSLRNQWLTADVFVSEGGLCCYGSLPYKEELDSLYAPIADTLSLRLEKLFPPTKMRHEISNDGKRLYYTGCQNSTLSPSYE